MKITTVECGEAKLRLAEPYTIAYETVTSASNVFLRLDTGRQVGFGCAAPDPEVTGENPEGTLEALREQAAPALQGEDPLPSGDIIAANPDAYRFLTRHLEGAANA